VSGVVLYRGKRAAGFRQRLRNDRRKGTASGETAPTTTGGDNSIPYDSSGSRDAGSDIAAHRLDYTQARRRQARQQLSTKAGDTTTHHSSSHIRGGDTCNGDRIFCRRIPNGRAGQAERTSSPPEPIPLAQPLLPTAHQSQFPQNLQIQRSTRPPTHVLAFALSFSTPTANPGIKRLHGPT